MPDEHKAAIAAGRVETVAMRDYLEALEPQRPKRGRQVNPEKLAERRTAIDSQLTAGDLKPIRRLELLPDRRDIDVQLAALAEEPDMTATNLRDKGHDAES